jgi:hypothetical protein
MAVFRGRRKRKKARPAEIPNYFKSILRNMNKKGKVRRR